MSQMQFEYARRLDDATPPGNPHSSSSMIPRADRCLVQYLVRVAKLLALPCDKVGDRRLATLHRPAHYDLEALFTHQTLWRCSSRLVRAAAATQPLPGTSLKFKFRRSVRDCGVPSYWQAANKRASGLGDEELLSSPRVPSK